MVLALSMDFDNGCTMKKIIIVGGGVAGLSALNRLIDLGISATLIEAGSYPSHKICGEFFSPECLPILNKWNLAPAKKIECVSFVTDRHTLSFSLPIHARSQSRFDFDQSLVRRAEEKGAKILTKTKVKDIGRSSIVLDSGEELSYSDLLISSGRFFGASSIPCYIGIKGHMKGIEIKNGLEMYPFSGGYAGLSSIDDDYSNFTCLMSMNMHRKEDLLQKLFEMAPHLQRRLQNGHLAFDNWMTCQIPAFGIKKTPQWANTYFIGDAAGTIPPASGLGLSIAITSGYMAADYAARGDSLGFQNAWYTKYKEVFTYGHLLHRLLTTPLAFRFVASIARLFPSLPLILFEKTRFLSKED